jgi:hypothetical protein
MSRLAIALIILICALHGAVTYQPGPSGAETAAGAVTLDCEGDACEQVTVIWDDSKQQYKVQNNSADQSVRVDAANLVASASVCVPPGKTDYLTLKSIAGAYHANHQQNCATSQQ